MDLDCLDCFTSFAKTRRRYSQRPGRRYGYLSSRAKRGDPRPLWWTDGWIASLRSQRRGVDIRKDEGVYMGTCLRERSVAIQGHDRGLMDECLV